MYPIQITMKQSLFCLTNLIWLSILSTALFRFVQSVNILCSDPIHYGTLELLIKSAEIPNNVCDLESECDLFVKIYVDGNFIGQSRTNINSNKPIFNEYFKIESVTNVSTLRLIVMDEDKLENMGADLQDENDEIFEIFLRIDEDILNENRNGKQMEVDGYSLKGIGAMGRLVFGVHWDSKFASCDFEQGDLHFAVKEAKIPWLLNSRNNLLKYQSIDLIGEVRVDGYLLGYTNRTMGKTHAIFDHSQFKAKNILNTFQISVRFFAANGSAFGRALDEQLCTVQATREDQRTEHDGWFECINNPPVNTMNMMNSMNSITPSASSNSPTTVTTISNKDKNPVDMMPLMALLNRNIEPTANNMIGPKVSNDVEKIQVRISYQWKPYYREIYQVNLLESRFEYVNLTNSLLDTYLRNITLLQAGTLRNEGTNTISTYYARAYNQMETFQLKLNGKQPMNRIFELFAQQPIELELPLLNSTLQPPYKFTNLYKTVRMPLACDSQNICKTNAQKLYTISEVISIGSETLAIPVWYAVWLADIPLQVRLQFALNGEWHSNANGSGIIKPNLIRELLIKHGLTNNQITTKEDYVIIELTGQLKANYGLDSCLHIKCKSLDNSGYQTELFKILH